MPSPVTPDQFRAIISDPTSTLCGNFVSTLLKFPVLFWRWFSWAFDPAGNPSNEFISSVVHTGDIIFSASNNEDASRLLCDGREVPTATYPNLSALIKGVYGTAGNSLNFILPDYRARFPCGVGSFPSGKSAQLGVKDGEELHVLTAPEGADKNHTHATGRFIGGALSATYFFSPVSTPTDTGLGYRNTGDGNSPASAQVEAQTGPWCATAGVLGGTDPVGHATLPPFLPAFVFIKT